jgi:hypothetical protein
VAAPDGRLVVFRTAAFVSLSLAVTTFAAPVPKHLMKEPVLYHPVEPGAKWVYRYYGHPEDEVGSDHTEVVIAVTEPKGIEKGVKVVERGYIHEGKVRESGSYTAVSAKGLTEGYVAASGGFVGHTPVLRIGDEPGTRWNTAYDDNNKQKHIFHGEEMVEVPAGKFRALRVETTFYFKGVTGQTWNRWYAPGVGLVKVEGTSGVRKVLKEFTPGKK